MSLVDEIQKRLEQVSFPGFRHSIVRYGMVDSVREAGGDVTVRLRPATRRREVAERLARRIREALTTLPEVRSVQVETAEPPRPTASAEAPQGAAVPGVRAIVAVSSAKGGVGKSTVAVNLALALRAAGRRVGLLDADVYGPSAPIMLGIRERPTAVGKKITPIERHGLSVMSMGFFLDDRSPVIWRGPMVMGLVRQFLRDVEWGEQDVLVVDMPPGTGDAALTLAQQVPISGAVVVTTPQEVALQDVERGIAMFRQLRVPVLGIVENMSFYVCPDCGERDEVFGRGGGESLARQFDVPLLARLPIVPAVREGGDAGVPIFASAPRGEVGKAFAGLAAAVERALAEGPAAPPP